MRVQVREASAALYKRKQQHFLSQHQTSGRVKIDRSSSCAKKELKTIIWEFTPTVIRGHLDRTFFCNLSFGNSGAVGFFRITWANSIA